MAMQLIERENQNRGFGRCHWLPRFDGSFNHAIMIRHFSARIIPHTSRRRSGLLSEPEKELQEVNNKLAALRTALDLAQTEKHCTRVPDKLILRTMKILVLDNYDSFTYNLVHLI